MYKWSWSVGMTIGIAKAVDLLAEKSQLCKTAGEGNLLKEITAGTARISLVPAQEVQLRIKDYAVCCVLNLSSVKSDEFNGIW